VDLYIHSPIHLHGAVLNYLSTGMTLHLLKHKIFHVAGCKSVVRSVTKLADHVRSHTKEKVVGCPTCGGLFANKAKFSDHCKRQISMECKLYTLIHITLEIKVEI
jgi:uncharacterized C2H2 Zn-finger protein